MDLLGTVLLLVLVGSEAQNLENVTVEPGRDVTLTCSVNSGDIYWFMEIHNQFRIEIGRTLSISSVYSQSEFKSKFSMSGKQLVIKSVSAEDSRLYYCGTKQNHQVVYKDTFRLPAAVNRPAVTGLFPAFPVSRSTSPSVRPNISSCPSCRCESERLTFIIYRSSSWASCSLRALLCCTGRGRGGSSRTPVSSLPSEDLNWSHQHSAAAAAVVLFCYLFVKCENRG